MKNEKLLKYSSGNVVITKKNIIAFEKLKQIKNYLIIKHFKQQGGTNGTNQENKNIKLSSNYHDSKLQFFNEERNKVKKNIDNLNFNNLETNKSMVEEIIKQIQSDAETKIKIDPQNLTELINADKALADSFTDFIKIQEQNQLTIDDNVLNTLLEIQKGLFQLQVKIIYNKLEKIKVTHTSSDMSPLFTYINNKIKAMNNYMEKQENNKTEQHTPPGDEDMPKLVETQNLDTNKNDKKQDESPIEFDEDNLIVVDNAPTQLTLANETQPDKTIINQLVVDKHNNANLLEEVTNDTKLYNNIIVSNPPIYDDYSLNEYISKSELRIQTLFNKYQIKTFNKFNQLLDILNTIILLINDLHDDNMQNDDIQKLLNEHVPSFSTYMYNKLFKNTYENAVINNLSHPFTLTEINKNEIINFIFNFEEEDDDSHKIANTLLERAYIYIQLYKLNIGDSIIKNNNNGLYFTNIENKT